MVDHLKHFGSAAKACFVSQPSLSAQIQKVEDEIGYLLFDRNKKPIVATGKGVTFVDQAKRVLREHARLNQLAKKDANEISGSLKLGMIPTVAPYLISLFVESFSKKYPKVDIEISEFTTTQIIDEIQKDRIDAAILATPLHQAGFHEVHLYQEPFFVFANPDHELSRIKKVTRKDVNSKGLWLLKDGHCFKNQALDVCGLKSESPLLPNVVFEGGNFETLCRLVKEVGGFTLVPERMTRTLSKADQTCLRPFQNPQPSRQISLVYRRDQWKKDILHALKQDIINRLSHEKPKAIGKLQIVDLKIK